MVVGRLNVDELRTLLQSDETYACFDVRERGEFGLGQIEGVTPLPRGTIEYRLATMVPRRHIPVVVLCDGGPRSTLAAETVAAMGYENVRVVEGGFAAWKANGLPTIAGWGVRGKEYAERLVVDRGVPQTTAAELAALRRQGQKVTVVDVRTDEEFLRGHVPDAYHIPGGQLLLDIPSLPRDPDHTLVISCAGRTRGILGAYVLREAGFPNVSALLNGAMGWALEGLDLESGPAKAQVDRAAPASYETLEVTRRLESEREIRRISIAELAALAASDRPFYLVDPRVPDEYRAGHLPGSISLPTGQFALQHENFMAVRRATVVIVGDDAIRPVWAAAQSMDLGFADTVILDGGLQAWAGVPGNTLEVGTPVAEVFGLAAARATTSVVGLDVGKEVAAGSSDRLLLDVRSSGEYGLGHIPGSRWLARGKLELDIERIVPDRDRPIVTVCDTGVRSMLAAATLRSLGYGDVAAMEGGIIAWRVADLGLVDTLDGADVSKIEAQNDAGSTQWTGALARSRADMENYLAAEEALAHRSSVDGLRAAESPA
jgi:rhodanese-related sulfurtransferase